MFLLFLAFVVLLSGFVAYAADHIARRVGRRHLRLFGLRPKTTALIVAVASGMGISFASVLAFGLLNRQALHNIAQADTLRHELRELREELEPLRETVRATETQLENVRAQATKLEKARDAAVAARVEADRQAEAAERERDEALLQADAAAATTQALQKRVDQLAARRDALARKAALAEQELKNTRQEAQAALAGAKQEAQAALAKAEQEAQAALAKAQQEAQAALASARDELKAAEQQIAGVERQLQKLEQTRAALEARVSEAQQREALARAEAQTAIRQTSTLKAQLQNLQHQAEQLTRQSATLTAERDRLRKERDKAQRDVLAEHARRDALVRDNENLRINLQNAQAERARLAGDVARATSELSATRSGDLVYEKGDLVHTQVIASVYNLPEALSGAQAKAASRGARGNPAAVLQPAALARLQKRVRELNWSALVVFRSTTNVVQGFPVELTADAFPNRVLYERGQIIRSGTLRFGTSEQMREQLLIILSDALVDLHGRGVPPEYISNGGLSQAEMQTFLSSLKGSGSARIGIASRVPVRPGMEVDLYPVVLP